MSRRGQSRAGVLTQKDNSVHVLCGVCDLLADGTLGENALTLQGQVAAAGEGEGKKIETCFP